MKKTLGVVAVATLATMPVMGAFAATGTLNHTDNIAINVGSVCTLGTVNADGTMNDDDSTVHTDGYGSWTNNNLAATMQAGTVQTLGSSTFTFRCNNSKGFNFKAVGAGESGHTTELFKPASSTETSDSAAIATGTGYGEGGVATGSSYWGFTLSNASEGVTIAPGYSVLHEIPAAETTIASTAAAASDLNLGQSVTVTYTAGLISGQAEGSYNGAVNYILAQID